MPSNQSLIQSTSQSFNQSTLSITTIISCFVTCSPQSCSPRTLLQQLHWLPIKHCIDFKIANVTFRTLHCSQLAYLRSSLHACHSTHSLRLSNTNLLSAPFVRTSFGSRSFSVTAPKIWNSLPLSLCTCTSPYMVTPSVVISRPTTASRPSTPLNPSLAPQIWLCWPLCAFINYIYLLTVTTFTQYNSQAEEGETFAASLHKTWSWWQASREVGWDLAAFSTQIWLYNAITGLKYSQNHTQ